MKKMASMAREAHGDVPAFLSLWSPPPERQQDNGIGDGDRPLQPRWPIFNLCHAAVSALRCFVGFPEGNQILYAP